MLTPLFKSTVMSLEERNPVINEQHMDKFVYKILNSNAKLQ